jgi:hypothetical protein
MRPSLTAKILFPSLTVALLFVFGIFTWFEGRLDDQARQGFNARVDHFVSAQAAALAGPVASRDQNSIDRLFNIIPGYPDAVGAKLVSADGEVIAHYERPMTVAKNATALTVAKDVVQVTADGRRILGSVQFTVDDSELRRILSARLWRDGIVTAAFTLSIMAAMAAALHWRVTRLMARLRQSLAADSPLEWDGKDEVGDLIAAYNQLQQRQAATEEALRRMRQAMGHWQGSSVR